MQLYGSESGITYSICCFRWVNDVVLWITKSWFEYVNSIKNGYRLTPTANQNDDQNAQVLTYTNKLLLLYWLMEYTISQIINLVRLL